jgi:hypothetical protein
MSTFTDFEISHPGQTTAYRFPVVSWLQGLRNGVQKIERYW